MVNLKMEDRILIYSSRVCYVTNGIHRHCDEKNILLDIKKLYCENWSLHNCMEVNDWYKVFLTELKSDPDLSTSPSKALNNSIQKHKDNPHLTEYMVIYQGILNDIFNNILNSDIHTDDLISDLEEVIKLESDVFKTALRYFDSFILQQINDIDIYNKLHTNTDVLSEAVNEDETIINALKEQIEIDISNTATSINFILPVKATFNSNIMFKHDILNKNDSIVIIDKNHKYYSHIQEFLNTIKEFEYKYLEIYSYAADNISYNKHIAYKMHDGNIKLVKSFTY